MAPILGGITGSPEGVPVAVGLQQQSEYPAELLAPNQVPKQFSRFRGGQGNNWGVPLLPYLVGLTTAGAEPVVVNEANMRARAAAFAVAYVDHAGSMAGAPTIEVPVGLNKSGNESTPPDSENETTPPELAEYDDDETGRRWHSI
eukprot:scaffold78308_cov25-Attheya_sp.AAC.1